MLLYVYVYFYFLFGWTISIILLPLITLFSRFIYTTTTTIQLPIPIHQCANEMGLFQWSLYGTGILASSNKRCLGLPLLSAAGGEREEGRQQEALYHEG